MLWMANGGPRPRAYVAECRKQISDQQAVVTNAQTHPPGQEAEVDFGEFRAWVDGVDTKLWMFVMRLSASGRSALPHGPVNVGIPNRTSSPHSRTGRVQPGSGV